MTLFRVYYLGGAEYQAARRHLGICERTWADWSEEIRRVVGRELTRAGVFPPSKYFREMTEEGVVVAQTELAAGKISTGTLACAVFSISTGWGCDRAGNSHRRECLCHSNMAPSGALDSNAAVPD